MHRRSTLVVRCLVRISLGRRMAVAVGASEIALDVAAHSLGELSFVDPSSDQEKNTDHGHEQQDVLDDGLATLVSSRTAYHSGPPSSAELGSAIAIQMAAAAI